MTYAIRILGFAFATLWFASLASAQTRTARDYFLDGQAAYQQGNYEAAIEAWRHAYELDPRPALQYNLAQAYGRLGRFEEERDSLRTYVDATAASGQAYDETQMQSARARLAAIEDRLRRTGVVLLGVPSDARVSVDGEAVTLDAGGNIPLSTGSHTIRVEREGYDEFDATVVVRGGEQLTIPVRLEEDTRPTVAAATSRRRGPGVGSYVTWGAAGAALVTGSVLGIAASNRADGAFVGTPEATSAKHLALGADLCFGATVALAATGVVLWLVGDDEAPVTTAMPYYDASSRGAGFVLRSSF